MHQSASYYARRFFEIYASHFAATPIKLIEIGSLNVNGSLRDVCPEGVEYTGLDFAHGPGVDVIINDPYQLPVHDEFADIVVTSSCLEHSEFFWLVFLEAMRILKPGGVLYINAPSNGYFHRYPVDCWRFYPDSGLALERWARRNGFRPKLLESFVGQRSEEDIWHDFVAVFVKDESYASDFPGRISSSSGAVYNVHSSLRQGIDRYSLQDPDFLLLTERKMQIAHLAQVAAERANRIGQLEQTIAEQGIAIARLTQQVAERVEVIGQLEQSTDRLEGRIAELAQLAETRAEQLDRHLQSMAALDVEVAYLSDLLRVRGDEIGRLEHTVSERDEEIARLTSVVTRHSEEMSRIMQASVALEGVNSRLSELVASGDAENSRLKQASVEQRAEVAHLGKCIAASRLEVERLMNLAAQQKNEIASLKELVNARDSQIEHLEQAGTERDAEVQRLIQLNSAKDEEVTQLKRITTESNAALRSLMLSFRTLQEQSDFHRRWAEALQQSRSWRWTKPFRSIANLYRAATRKPKIAFKRAAARTPLVRKSAINRVRASYLFDQHYYCERYPDIAASSVDAAKHYHLVGWREHRDPSPEFCTQDYLELNPDVASAGINPLLHYIEYGQQEGRQIHRSVEKHASQPEEQATSECLEGVQKGSALEGAKEPALDDSQITPESSPSASDLERINAEVEAIRASGLFDSAFYLAMYPDIQPQPIDPIRHYCEFGWKEGRDPSNDFDTSGYLDAYGDIKNAGLNPFWHYVVAGRSESRQTLPSANSRYEDDAYFGVLASDIQLIATYAAPTWSAVLSARGAVKGAGRVYMPNDDLGFYAPSGTDTLTKQAQMARRHGISAWCFKLEPSQDLGFSSPLTEFLSRREVDIRFVVDLDSRYAQGNVKGDANLPVALTDNRYLRIDGSPVLIVTLYGDDQEFNRITSTLDTYLDGRTDVFLVARCDGLSPNSVTTASRIGCKAILDCASLSSVGEAGSFVPVRKDGTSSVPYSVVVSQALSRLTQVPDDGIPVYRMLTVGRDDSPLKPTTALRFTRFNLREYRRWLDATISDTRTQHPHDRRLLFINAWNDWNMGSFLEPDRITGYSKLNETSRALKGLPCGQALPKVSVIVPNYNHAKYLRRRLDSIYEQSYKNLEVLLLDDCSTDQSREILTEYAERYATITKTLFNHENSGGVFRQWAKGIKAASGDLIWIAESDDFCDDNFVETLVRCFDDEAVLLAYAKCQFVRADESAMEDDFWHHVRDLCPQEKWKQSYVNTAHQEVSQVLGIINTIPNASGAIFRRPVDMKLLEHEWWLSMRVVGDWIFYLHLIRGGKLAYSFDTSNYFRRYDASTAEKAYRSETFYKELGLASRTVGRLYDVSKGVLEKAKVRSRELYNYFCSMSDDDFQRLYHSEAMHEEEDRRTPNLLVSTMGFYPGGAEIFPIRLANEFKRRGHSVLLLSCQYGGVEDGVRRLLRRDIPVVATSDLVETRKLIEEFGIEVLNSHQWHVQKYPTQLPDTFSRLSVHVASLHGMIEYGTAFGVTSEQLRTAHDNVTTWAYTADKNLGPFIEHGLYQRDRERFIKLPNGMQPPNVNRISRTEIGVPEGAFVLCCVSRAIPDKGWAEAIAAVTVAREMTSINIHLILVGNGPVYDEYTSIGVPSFVHLMGFSENSVGYYAAADMGIMLTKFKSESFPLTIVDCLFAGRPFIATAVGEIRNMLTTELGVAGAVLDLEDWVVPVEAASEVIAKFASDQKAYGSAKVLVDEVASRYKIDSVAQQYLSIFQDTFEARRRNAATVK